MPARRLNPEDIERIIEMRERGRTYGVIARVLGCSESTVSYHCIRLAIDPPNPRRLPPMGGRPPVVMRNGHAVRAYTAEDDARILAMDAEGASDSEMGRALGRRAHSVRQRLMTLARREARAEACA
ncbi:helix-turn-helix domain-containing protein [Methylobacterium sp. W2]|uniref:helix-turn-helix domain-containing protein n=1 Tax=Methylobacterium sp. W2 TaxID=2598107 RepID=UPI001D0CD34C|nr:helix-turn-helix domain-containing protein [Methylobacterium sp. W2]